MPDGSDSAIIRVLGSLGDIAAAEWDACAGDADPFVGHGFLSALEESGSVAPETGWQPRHLLLEDASGAVLGAAPLYLKNHSYGEYVFDWAWADAYHRAGGRYYPKLVSAVPFTPATGRRLLVAPGCPPQTLKERRIALLSGMVRLAERTGVSSLHINFPEAEEWQLAGDAGFLLRTDRQFHWENAGYASFEDFLGRLSSRKRKTIRKERKAVAAAGVSMEWRTGADIEERHWDAFYGFYCNTSERKWGETYLNRAFFSRLGERLKDRVLLVLASRDERIVGGALNLIGADTLFGRYWGCGERIPFLHFEVSYYQAIEFAIARGLSRIEAGAQGEHKLQRGYLPSTTRSAHWIADPAFREAVARYLAEERAAIDDDIGALLEFSPFRKNDG